MSEPVAPGEEQHADDADGRRDDVAEFLDLAQQRRLESTDVREHLVDAAEFRLAAGRDNDAGRPARNHHGPGKRHVSPVADGGLVGYQGRGLFCRDRFAREGCLLCAQVLGIDEAHVRRDLVARFQEDDVAWNKFCSPRASVDSMSRIASSAFSARPSCRKPKSEFRMTTAKMIEASSHRLSISLMKPAARRT